MADTRSPDGPGQSDHTPGVRAGSLIMRRHGVRVMLLSLASAALLLGAVAAGAFTYTNHAVSDIGRVPVSYLTQAGPSGAMTVLLTGSQVGPTGESTFARASGETGLIMLLHINANHRAGAVVSISPQITVDVPGHGTMLLGDVAAVGGSSLLVKTVHRLTGVPVNHYARIDFRHVASVIDAVHGVWVRLPETTESFGYVFHRGLDHIYGAEALAYARQPSLTENGRVLRQQSLIRAVLDKLADHHLLDRPWRMWYVLDVLSDMLTVDSTLTDYQLEKLAFELRCLSSRDATFVAAPTKMVNGSVVLNAPESSRLWAAIVHDSVAAFAGRYPATVTPNAP